MKQQQKKFNKTIIAKQQTTRRFLAFISIPNAETIMKVMNKK